LGSLKCNREYFGKPTKEDAEKNLTSYSGKITFINCFDNPKYGAAIFKMIFQIFTYYSTELFNDEIFDKVISNYIYSFDDLKKKSLIPIYGDKGKDKGKVIGYKKLKLPAKSPMLLSSEFEFYCEILRAQWMNLDYYKNNYYSLILANASNYSLIESKIRETNSVRTTLKQKFAKLTTKHLNHIRKFTKEEKLKKNKVTTQMVMDLWTNGSLSFDIFVEGVNSLILPGNNRDTIMSQIMLKEKKSDLSIQDFLSYKFLSIKNTHMKDKMNKDDTDSYVKLNGVITDVTIASQCVEHIHGVNNKLKVLFSWIKTLKGTNNPGLQSRCIHGILKISKSIALEITAILGVKKNAFEMAIISLGFMNQESFMVVFKPFSIIYRLYEDLEKNLDKQPKNLSKTLIEFALGKIYDFSSTIGELNSIIKD
jgi:hypothetical protein